LFPRTNQLKLFLGYGDENEKYFNFPIQILDGFMINDEGFK
jgi:hypothetical protein